MNVQKDSLALINFNPIPKDIIFALVFGQEQEFPEGEKVNYPDALRMLAIDNEDEIHTAADVYTSLQSNDSQGQMIEEFSLTEQATLKGISIFGLAVVVCIVFMIVFYFLVKKCSPKCHKTV